MPAIANGERHVTLTDAGLLDVHVRDTEIAVLLQMLSYEAQANIVASTSVKGKISANLYSVTLEQALEAILIPSNYAFCTLGATIFVGTPQEMAGLQPPPVTRVFKLRHIGPKAAAEAVRAVLGEDAKVVESEADDKKKGGGSDEDLTGSEAGTNYLIVTDYPQRLTAAESVLAEVDERPKQVLIEATILRATLTEANQFGIDFAMLGGVDFQDVGSTSDAAANLETGALPQADLQSTTFNVNTQFTGVVDGGGFTFGLIKDSVAGFIRALEEVTDVVVVANPKVVSLNKQDGEVIVGRRDGYMTTTVTETAAIQTVEYLETGTQLRFRPTINDDMTVRLAVHPKDSNGGLTAANLPFEETTEARTNILLDDGDTVLIGGLFRERTVASRNQIPVLGDIPGAGLLFRGQADRTVREEVIILLTVHVIKETPAEQEGFRTLLDDIERVRVGTRRGLLGTGRERLAQAYYHEALRQLEEGDQKRALLNARMALNCQPSHLRALKLKERVLGERLWEDEGGRMRTLVWDLLDGSPNEELAPPFGRPALVVPPPVAEEDAIDALDTDDTTEGTEDRVGRTSRSDRGGVTP